MKFGDGQFRCQEPPFECPVGQACSEAGVCVTGGTADAGFDGSGGGPVVPEFGPPVLIEELADLDANDDDGSYSADLLMMVFASDRGSVGADLWTSSRASIAEPWSPPTVDNDLSSAANESTVALSADGLTIMFGRTDTVNGLGGTDVFVSSRPNRLARWSPPTLVASLSSAENDTASWISNGATSVVVASERDGNFDLFAADFDEETGAYGTLVGVPGINTQEPEYSGRFAMGGLVFTFHSERPGNAGRSDGYVATRSSLEEPFGSAVPIAAMNTVNNDEDVWLSDDLCTLFCATRNGPDQDLFVATCTAP